MGGTRDGILGLTPDPAQRGGATPLDILGDGHAPGSLGIDDTTLDPPSVINPRPIPLVDRIIAAVKKDWEPPNPRTTPDINIGGATLEQAGKDLDKRNEWGEGGGMLRADPIGSGTSTNLTVNLHANLVHRLPKWSGYAKASAAAKAEWDKMLAALRAHEDRHMEIAIEEGNQLAADLIGHDISDIASMVTAANKRMALRQRQLDQDTNNGAKPGVPYGDVVLDTTIV